MVYRGCFGHRVSPCDQPQTVAGGPGPRCRLPGTPTLWVYPAVHVEDNVIMSQTHGARVCLSSSVRVMFH